MIYLRMPSFADSIFLFVLALLLFGPKKLPVLARELGKWIGEFRRASNEFKMQMEDELRLSEQADRQKQIAAMEAAAPLSPPLEAEHPHLPKADVPTSPVPSAAEFSAEAGEPEHTIHISGSAVAASPSQAAKEAAPESLDGVRPVSLDGVRPESLDGVRPAPLPIATSGELRMMPPPTGLPTPRPRNLHPLGGLLEAIPEETNPTAPRPEPAFVESDRETIQETATHAD